MKALLIDCGDVITKFSFKVFANFIKSRGCSLESDKKFFKEKKPLYDGGDLEREEFWTEYIKATGINATPNELDNEIRKTINVDKGMLEILKKVRKKRHKVILASNIDSTTYEEVLKQIIDVNKYFDATYVSYNMKILKIQPDFFRLILKEQNLAAENCLFVDNYEENVIVAKSIGIQGYIFKNKNLFKDKLKQLGFL